MVATAKMMIILMLVAFWLECYYLGSGSFIIASSLFAAKSKTYFEELMSNDNLQALVDAKTSIGATVGGGVTAFAATPQNLIGLAGALIGFAGLVVAILQWLANREKNRIAEEKKQLDREIHEFNKAQAAKAEERAGKDE